jgi:hypothetical protein
MILNKLRLSLVALGLVSLSIFPVMAQKAAPPSEAPVIEETGTLPETPATPAENAALANGPGAETRDALKNFLETSNSQTALTAAATVSRTFPLSVFNFIYTNGGIGLPDGPINTNSFESYFTAPFGILAGSNASIVPGPVTARADSTFSPNLTQADIDKLVSVKVKFTNFLVSDNNRQLSLRLVIRNVTTGSTQIVNGLPPSAGSSYTFNIKRFIQTPGQYAIGFVFRKPAGAQDVTGFGDAAVIVTRN